MALRSAQSNRAMPEPFPDAEAESRKQLMMLMTRHQRQIFAYIYTLVPDRHDAEDLLQETSVVICDKFSEFKLGTDFVAWACQVAWWRIRYSRQKFARSKVIFDDTVLESAAHTASTASTRPRTFASPVTNDGNPGTRVTSGSRTISRTAATGMA